MVLRIPACCADNVELDNRLRWTYLRCSLSQSMVGEAQEKKNMAYLEEINNGKYFFKRYKTIAG